MTEFQTIKKHWNEVGGQGYQFFWDSSYALKGLSDKEKSFVKDFIPFKKIRAMDYGCGSGRFISVLLEKSSPDSEIYGLDISEDMVRYCQGKFEKDSRVKEIKAIQRTGDYYNMKFDIITAIRVLKYNKDWKDILNDLFGLLEQGGLIIFTMPKKYILGSFKPFRASIKEVKGICSPVEIKGFAKIPDFLYRIRNKFFSRIVLFMEAILRVIFGTKLFEREVFFVVKKPWN